MLESIRKGQRWLTLLLVAFVGAVFVFFMGVGGQFGPGSPSGNAVVQISDTQMLEGDFNRLRARLEQFYRDEMGEQFDGREQEDALNALALRELVNQVVLAHSARELGIRVDREEIQQLVTQSPEFRDDTGRFNKDAFVEYAKWEYGSQRAFIERMRIDLLRQKMIALLYDQASVSPSEARDAALYGLEQRRLAYVTLDPTQLPPGDPQAEIDDETVTAWVEANNESLQSAYQENSDQYAEPAEATARHILIAVDRDADPEAVEAARTRAEAARQRLAGGEDFAAVALEVSEDEGTREDGGALGSFARGERISEIDEAAFALQPGDLSEVFQTDAGFHVLRLDSLQPERTRPFDEVAPELAREEILQQRANERAQQLSVELADAIQAGQSLEEAAREQDLTLGRTPLFTRRPDGFLPGLGAAADVMDTAFTLDLDRPSSPTVHRVGNQLVMIQLTEHNMPGAEELDATVEQIQPNLLDAKRNRMVQDWIETRREALEKNGDLLVNSSAVITPAL